MRLKDTKTVKAMIDRMNAQSIDYNDLSNKPTINGVEVTGALTSTDLDVATAPEDIILEGNIMWLMGGSFDLEDAEDITKLNHFEELLMAGKRPRFGFELTYTDQGQTIESRAAAEPDNIAIFPGEGEENGFSAFFSIYLGSYGFFGVTLARNSDAWALIVEKINQ